MYYIICSLEVIASEVWHKERSFEWVTEKRFFTQAISMNSIRFG